MDNILLKCEKNDVTVILVLDSLEIACKNEIESLYTFRKLVDKSQIKIIEGNFGNPGSARNAALKFVDSDWIVFWDADDEPKVNEITKMIRIAESKKKAIAIGEFARYDFNEKKYILQKKVKDKSLNLQNIARQPGIWRWAFSKSVIDSIHFPELNMGEDQIYLLRIKFSESCIFYYDEITYIYTTFDCII